MRRKVRAEQEALRAKMICAEKEVEVLNKLLEAYSEAESCFD